MTNLKTNVFLITASSVLALSAAGLSGCNRKSLESDRDQQSYTVGFALGQQLAKVRDDVDPEIVARGLKDGIKSDSQLGKEVMEKRLGELQVKQQEREVLSAAETLKKSVEYISATSKKAGVRSLAEGVLIEESKAGTGTPRALKDDDEIVVSYIAKRSDGAVFDQTADPAGVKLKYRDLLLPGLKLAVAKMPVGAEWVVHLAPDKAFGAASRPGIPSQSALVYEIKLVGVNPKK